MYNEKVTRQKPNLPEADYTVIARLTAFGDQPYGVAQAIALQDCLHLETREVQLEDNNLFVRLHVGRAANELVWQEAAHVLHRGLARLAITPDIDAGADITSMIDRSRPLSVTFPYLEHDISRDLVNELSSLNTEPVEQFDFDGELRLLAEHHSI